MPNLLPPLDTQGEWVRSVPVMTWACLLSPYCSERIGRVLYTGMFIWHSTLRQIVIMDGCSNNAHYECRTAKEPVEPAKAISHHNSDLYCSTSCHVSCYGLCSLWRPAQYRGNISDKPDSTVTGNSIGKAHGNGTFPESDFLVEACLER